MTLWHLVQIDSQCNRRTDRDRDRLFGQTGRQTGQVHDQHSVVWHQESERGIMGDFVSSLEGSVDPQTEVRRTPAVGPVAVHVLTSL